MKIAIDAGHNCPPDVGCPGIIQEDRLTREVETHLITELTKRGFSVLSVVPDKATSISDSLRQRVLKANQNDVNWYISIHFNCFDKKAQGTEVFAISPQGRDMANRILQNIVNAIGTTNRGVKDGSHLYVLKYTNMPAVLVEALFCDNAEDMKKYDAKKIATAIAEAFA